MKKSFGHEGRWLATVSGVSIQAPLRRGYLCINLRRPEVSHVDIWGKFSEPRQEVGQIH